jgi:uncharacterized secreted protein with C-terminal beta-propeller domain
MMREGAGRGPADERRWAVARRLLVVGALGALAALGVLSVAQAGTAEEPEATAGAAASARAPASARPALTRFASCRGFVAHVRRRAARVVVPAAEGAADRLAIAPAAGPAPARPGVDYSDTNVQEAGVDEPDLVETDGRTIFSLAAGRLEIVDVTGAAPRPLDGLDLGGIAASGLLLAGDRLLVLGDAGPVVPVQPLAAPARASVLPAPVESTALVQVDVADPSRPRVMARMRVDGRLVTARAAGDTVRVVLSSFPSRVPLTARGVDRAGADAWLPRLTLRDVAAGRTVRRAAVGCRDVSRPARFSGLGMTTVLTVGLAQTMTPLDSDAILTDGDVVAASTTALYVATPPWAGPQAAGAESPPRGATLVHKLDTSDPARTTYRASGAVRGYLLNQFALSEHDGYLRAASTEEPDWWTPPDGDARPGESIVTVLAERGGRLVPVGRVDGLGRGERIHAVRFMGARAYVVTFRQTDPLYAVDLADPANPVVRGALKIPGYSAYLHPVDEHHLIGIGQDATEEGRPLGAQVSLFDVADPAAPRRIARRTLDADWSEAESDHHAVLYWPATRLLVVPVEDARASFSGAVGLHVAPETGITPIARLRHPADAAAGAGAIRRSLVIGDALYSVSDAGVLASDLATLAPRAWTPFR